MTAVWTDHHRLWPQCEPTASRLRVRRGPAANRPCTRRGPAATARAYGEGRPPAACACGEERVIANGLWGRPVTDSDCGRESTAGG